MLDTVPTRVAFRLKEIFVTLKNHTFIIYLYKIKSEYEITEIF